MSISTRTNQDVTIIDCSGRLEGDGVTQWRNAIMKALDRGAKKLLINLSAVEWLGKDADQALLDMLMRDHIDGKYHARIALLIPSGDKAWGMGTGVMAVMEVGDYFTSESEAVASSLQMSSYTPSYGEDDL